jgi:hypothetical protein
MPVNITPTYLFASFSSANPPECENGRNRISPLLRVVWGSYPISHVNEKIQMPLKRVFINGC